MMNDNYLSVISETVNLNGYGTSEKWMGYFERNVKFTKKTVDNTIRFFLNYFKNDLDNFIIASSYYIDSNVLDRKSDCYIFKDVLSAEKDLIVNKFISLFDFSKYFDYENNEIFEFQLKNIETNFKFVKSTPELIKQFSLIAMCPSHRGYQDGHCFFISIEKNIIIYPHSEDTGYGCFIIDKDKSSISFNFLQKANELKSFRTYFRIPEGATNLSVPKIT